MRGGNHSAGATPSGFQQYLGPYLNQAPAPWMPPTSDYVHHKGPVVWAR